MTVRELSQSEVVQLSGELLRLQRAAYAIEAELIGDDRIPPLHESREELIEAKLTWLVITHRRDEAAHESAIVAALAYQRVGGLVDIDRLIVHPDHHRRGLARALVTAALALQAPTVVSTGRDNIPARRLYRALGFLETSEDEVLPGLWVVQHTLTPPTRQAASK